jgi:dipeptidyl aminopeptidase/acylaminoacyl peptidase
MKKLLLVFLLGSTTCALAQQLGELTVDKIMRDPTWMGTAPTNIQWAENSRHIFFNWNPERAETDQLYQISTSNKSPEKVSDELRRSLERTALTYSLDRKSLLFERNGDIVLKTISSGTEIPLTNTVERETNALFSTDGNSVIFQRGDNLYRTSLKDGRLTQLSNFTKTKPRPQAKLSQQDEWLKQDQLKAFDIIRERDQNRITTEKKNRTEAVRRPKEFYLDERSTISSLKISPDERYIAFRITKSAEGNKNIIVPNYVTASGYTENINGRTKVGNALPTFESYIYDVTRDTIYPISTREIPGIKDFPDYLKDYPDQLAESSRKNEDRKVSIIGPFWNLTGSQAVVVVNALDNKDRWIMKVDPSTGQLSLLDRQRDEAWIGGPGINSFNGGSLGWINNDVFYFQSEATGYSHLYIVNVVSGEKKQITSGKYEVQTVRLSNDKRNFYYTSNEDHPGITHFYRIPVQGGRSIKLTSMKGGHEVSMSPDEKWIAFRYSYSNKPWELFLQENKPGAKAEQITTSVSDEFKSYAWRDPEMVSFKNRFGSDVYARIYKPEKMDPSKPAVLFVHGAGYLQNVHYWWSQYFREYMFNNLLADKGYTVIDVDYTGSSGYGRDHRTGIYRHMGGKDLSDHVDAVKLLVGQYGVNAENIGIYGGSYGGFITLMGMFTEPDVFKSGAALRSVTDWAHYNHGYTSNILNEPAKDEKSYRQSSPIYFADGLRGNLLMAHGMVDVNVNFQDIVRLSQRLLELKKENWELAVYPVEDHAFTESSSWADEYKRILKLFEATLRAK